MTKFFKFLKNIRELNEWLDVLDWLFEDNKFSESEMWNRGYVGNFTKKIKRLESLKIITVNAGEVEKEAKKLKKAKGYYIVMTNRNVIARDIIRHIRNSIAHNRVAIKENNFIEIKDYKNNTDASNDINATCFMYMPLNYILQIHNIYKNIKKAISNTKQIDRKKTKRRKSNETINM